MNWRERGKKLSTIANWHLQLSLHQLFCHIFYALGKKLLNEWMEVKEDKKKKNLHEKFSFYRKKVEGKFSINNSILWALSLIPTAKLHVSESWSTVWLVMDLFFNPLLFSLPYFPQLLCASHLFLLSRLPLYLQAKLFIIMRCIV